MRFIFDNAHWETIDLVQTRHPGESRGPVGGCSPILDTGFRRYDDNFLLHWAGAITKQPPGSMLCKKSSKVS